jgi:hypothetical protein
MTAEVVSMRDVKLVEEYDQIIADLEMTCGAIAALKFNAALTAEDKAAPIARTLAREEAHLAERTKRFREVVAILKEGAAARRVAYGINAPQIS